MPKRQPKVYPEVGAIVDKVLGGASPAQASIRVGYRVGKEAIRTLKSGKVGWESTVREFAENFAEKLCEHYGDERLSGFFC